jgi:hypothetical protein
LNPVIFTVAAIEFASPAMLGWLAAAALPWLINLWSRRRHVETPWAAVDLLLAAVRERSRRLRLRELLLLALRTAILLLVAFAAARPLWRQAASAGSTAVRTHHVIVIDQSFSMATDANESSRFELALSRARQIVEDAPSGDAFTVIAWSETADNIPGRATFDAASALAAIESIERVDTVANLAVAVRTVDAAIKTTRKEFPGLGRTRVAFVSDLGLNTWSAALRKPASGDRGKSDGEAEWAELAAASEIVIESVDDGVRQNIAITDIAIDPPLPVLGRPITVAVQLKSFGDAMANLNVQLLLDGTRVAQQAANLAANGEATLRFDARLIEPGNHVLEARLPDDVDVLAVDNRRWLSTEATLGARVLCVADVPSAAEDIARALNPRFRDGAAEDAIGVETVATAGLAAAELSAFDAVFICNVAELSIREQRLLERYVASGGAVVFVLGDRIQAASYRDIFNTKTGLLPIEIAEQPSTGDWRLDPLDHLHPVMQPFARRSRSGLLGVRVSQYFPLRIVGEGSAPAVALAFTSGDPALIIGEHGLGRVAVLATDPALTTRTEPWSTFAVSPSFVPLVRELFSYLSADRRTERLNRIVGEPLALPFDATGVAPGDVEWKNPAGGVTTAPPETNRRGVYTVLREKPGSDGGETAAIAVNVDTSESDLAAVDAGDLQQIGVVEGAEPAASSLPYAGAVSLQGYLLAAAAALALVELTVAWLFGRGWA